MPDYPFVYFYECRRCRQQTRHEALSASRDRRGVMWGRYRCECGWEDEQSLTIQDFEELARLVPQAPAAGQERLGL
jgi:hypothetical protein